MRFKTLFFEKIFQASSDACFKKILKKFYIFGFAKSIYLKLTYPKGGKYSYVINGITAQFCVNKSEDVSYILSLREHKILGKLLRLVRPGDIVYDVGAAVGFYTVFLSKKSGEAGRVFAFEPDSERYKILSENIKLNHLDNTTAYQLALGEESKKAILIQDADLKIESIGNNNSNSQIINVVPGDVLVDKNNLALPNIVKIDVEGYEYFVIKGLERALRDKSCRIVCCEIHHNQLPDGVNKETVLSLLKDVGFKKIEVFPQIHGCTSHAFCYKTV